MTRTNHAKRLSGTDRADRAWHPQGALALTALPPAPSHLSANATAAWERLGQLAIAAGTLTGCDLELLALAARTAATCDDLEHEIKTHGSLLDSRGAVKAHPACAALDRSRGLLLKLLDALGLSPSGRERLSIDYPVARSNRFAARGMLNRNET